MRLLIFGILAGLIVVACAKVENLWHNKVEENKKPARECFIYEDELEIED